MMNGSLLIVLLPGFQKGRISRLLKKRPGSSFGQKRAICIVQGKTLKMRKTDRISLFSGSIKCFSRAVFTGGRGAAAPSHPKKILHTFLGKAKYFMVTLSSG
jgi:hypothetical protein